VNRTFERSINNVRLILKITAVMRGWPRDPREILSSIGKNVAVMGSEIS
jgi:hypothetical protein